VGTGGSGNTTVGATGGTSQGTNGLLLFGSPYANVNMWYGRVDFSQSVYHNGCGQSDGSKYPATIQNLYGNYLIGLNGDNIPKVENRCDNCAQLTANGTTIVARIITYGQQNGVDAIDLSPDARTVLGLSDSNWAGAWQTVSGVDFFCGFQVRVTANDKQQLTDSIPAPGGLNPANPVAGQTNFK